MIVQSVMTKFFSAALACLFLLSACGGPSKKPVIASHPREQPVRQVPQAKKDTTKPSQAGEVRPSGPIAAGKQSLESGATPQSSSQGPAAAVKTIEAVQHKRVFEYVQLGGEKYPLPEQWRGRKLKVKPLSSENLKQIPVVYTYNSTKLFILKETVDAFVEMARQAGKDHIDLIVHSAYRSIYYQRKMIKKMMKDGRTWEDLIRYVAPPGYSEHMLGTVIDLYPSDWSFASTPKYQWLKEHAAAFGFSETYPESGKDGFPWEPWHWKYTGVGAGAKKAD